MELEIKVLWCRGLTAFNFFQKLSIYSAVSITSEDERIQLTPDQIQEQKTPIDEDNEGNPEWNHPMKFDLKPLNFIDPNFNDLSLLFELRNQGQLFGDKVIGEVRVPLKDLIDSVGGEIVRFVSYEVRNPEGKHNGILDFSYKVIDDVNNSRVNSSNNGVYITGYQHHHDYQLQFDQNSANYDVNVDGYHHHHHHNHSHNHQFDSYIQGRDSEIHMTGYHHHNLSNDSVILSETERIQYPKIEFEDDDNHNSMVSVYPHISSSLTMTAANAAEYQLSAPDIYPPPQPRPPQPWAPPPRPLPRPYVYPPPPPSQPYGDPHWGYHRPPNYHHNW
ncbi:Protein SRC2-like protein [Bienertia sinuspersici]